MESKTASSCSGAGHAILFLGQPAGEYGLQDLEVDRRVVSEVGGPSANTRPRAAPSSWWVVVRRVRDEFTVAQPRSMTICCLIVSQETTSFLSPARGCATSDSGVAQRAGSEWIGKAAYLNAHTRPSFSSPRGREGGRANFCNMYSLPYRGWAVGVICALSLFVPYLLGLFFFWGGGGITFERNLRSTVKSFFGLSILSIHLLHIHILGGYLGQLFTLPIFLCGLNKSLRIGQPETTVIRTHR